MKLHVLFKTLINLDRKEMTRFKDFVLSPYFNKHEEVRTLVLYFNSIYPQFTAKSCSLPNLAKNAFAGHKKGAKQIPVLLTYTRRLLDNFLDLEGYRNSELSNSIFLLSQLREKKQRKAYEKNLKRLQSISEEEEQRDSAHYYKQFLLEQKADQQYVHLGVSNQENALQRKGDHLDAYYLSEKIKDACEALVRGRMTKVTYSSVLLEAIFKIVEEDKERYFKIPPINVYYHIHQMIVKEEMVYYEAALDSATKHTSFFPKTELQNIYNYLQNYCVYQINKGEVEFLRATFQLYKIQLDKELLLVNDLLPEWHYKNVTTVGLRLQEIGWVKKFLDEYRPLLSVEVRENAYAYNLAEYYYATENYKKALQLLLEVSYTDTRYSMSSKALLLRTYYDLEEHEALVALCKSFLQLLHRNKSISDFRRKGYKHLFLLTQKSSQLRNNLAFTKKQKNKTALEKLKKELSDLSPIFNLPWLEERVNSMME